MNLRGDQSLENLRHSLAHLLAAAVLKIYPKAKPTLGPPVNDGFYYDFDFSAYGGSPKDLLKIEKEMRRVLPSWNCFEKVEVTAEEAKKIFADNTYKLEIINELEEKKEPITLYFSGQKDQIPQKLELLKAKSCQLKAGFLDLCRGGHVENPSKEINSDAFKLDRIAGAYWRGDEKNKMLTRIYGLAFKTGEDLENYEKQKEEAEKRDHRKLGKELDLFTFSDLVGAGLPLFTPKGTVMRNAITEKISFIQEKFGYQNVTIPHITKPDLYKISGHWEKFGNELFKVQGKESEFVIKPMNCPHHTQIYASSPKSYKNLPVRFAETTMVYRDEQTGELLGLSRVRSVTQDDGHVFCADSQMEQEIKNIISVTESFYESLGMYEKDNFWVRISLHDPDIKEKFLGEDALWEKAESILEKLAKENNLPHKKVKGEAAFYGPKLDFMFKDAIGREWQLATIQLDFVMPSRFGLEYTDKDGSKKTPVMIHRAITGSLERFMAVLIEHFAGAFPFWLSPVQVKVLSIGEGYSEYAGGVFGALKEHDIRAEFDDSDETLGKKVRNARTEKVPYWLVVGAKEKDSQTVMVESRDQGNLGQKTLKEFLELCRK